jgi:carboxypeptidase Q
MFRHHTLSAFLALLILPALSAAAQISAPEPDPLARMRQAAAANAQGACSESELSACAQAAPKIIANALGPSPLAENLRRLTDEIGGRLTGSPAMAKAVQWAVAAFRDAGIDDVHTEKFTIPPTWSEGATRIEVLSGSAFPLHAVSVAWSPATPPGGIEAALVDAGAGAEEDFGRLGGAARGAILLVHTDVLRTFDDLFAEYLRNPAIIARATSAGAAIDTSPGWGRTAQSRSCRRPSLPAKMPRGWRAGWQRDSGFGCA